MDQFLQKSLYLGIVMLDLFLLWECCGPKYKAQMPKLGFSLTLATSNFSHWVVDLSFALEASRQPSLPRAAASLHLLEQPAFASSCNQFFFCSCSQPSSDLTANNSCHGRVLGLGLLVAKRLSASCVDRLILSIKDL
ncbi:hypothetical protein Droror1_Dr00024393 [Drosera rotundifolia]